MSFVFGNVFSGVLQYFEYLEIIRYNLASYGLRLDYDLVVNAIVYLATEVAVFAVMYFFMSIGLYKLSVKNKVSTPALSFVPFARYYQMGKLVGEVRLFGLNVKNLGLFVTVFSAFDFVCANAYDYLTYSETFFKIFSTANEQILVPDDTALIYLVELINIVFIVFYVMLVVGLFRSYEKRFSLLYSLLGIFFGITGIFVFVIRNHTKIDRYAEMKKFYESGGYSGTPFKGRFGGSYSDGFYEGGPFEERRDPYGDKKQQSSDVFEEYSENGAGDDRNGSPFDAYEKDDRFKSGNTKYDDNGDDLF